MPKVPQQVGSRHGSSNPLLSNAPGCPQESRARCGLRPRAKETGTRGAKARTCVLSESPEAEENPEGVLGLSIRQVPPLPTPNTHPSPYRLQELQTPLFLHKAGGWLWEFLFFGYLGVHHGRHTHEWCACTGVDVLTCLQVYLGIHS